MKTYFNLTYEFDREQVHERIAARLKEPGSAYICVADGVVLNTANRKPEYMKVLNGSMFSICDSSYVPLYLKWIYGVRYRHYCGSEILMDIVKSRKYRMIFMGTSHPTLQGLKKNLTKENPDVAGMQFLDLPYLDVNDFDYADIARIIEADGADIVWVAMGAPKQETFMSKLQPYLSHGVMIAVGAAFKFHSGTDTRRAPKWMVDMRLEFVYRILREPKKQLKRCAWIVYTLPGLLIGEWQRKRLGKHQRID